MLRYVLLIPMVLYDHFLRASAALGQEICVWLCYRRRRKCWLPHHAGSWIGKNLRAVQMAAAS